MKNKSYCQRCGKQGNSSSFTYIRGEFLCHNCKRKSIQSKSMERAQSIGKSYYSLKQALEKEYKVKTYISNNHIQCLISVPSILSGKKVKLVLVDDEI